MDRQLAELAEVFSPTAVVQYRRHLLDTDAWSVLYTPLRYWLDSAIKAVADAVRHARSAGRLSNGQIQEFFSGVARALRQNAVERFGSAHMELFGTWTTSDRKQLERAIQLQLDYRYREWISPEERSTGTTSSEPRSDTGNASAGPVAPRIGQLPAATRQGTSSRVTGPTQDGGSSLAVEHALRELDTKLLESIGHLSANMSLPDPQSAIWQLVVQWSDDAADIVAAEIPVGISEELFMSRVCGIVEKLVTRAHRSWPLWAEPFSVHFGTSFAFTTTVAESLSNRLWSRFWDRRNRTSLQQESSRKPRVGGSGLGNLESSNACSDPAVLREKSRPLAGSGFQQSESSNALPLTQSSKLGLAPVPRRAESMDTKQLVPPETSFPSELAASGTDQTGVEAELPIIAAGKRIALHKAKLRAEVESLFLRKQLPTFSELLQCFKRYALSNLDSMAKAFFEAAENSKEYGDALRDRLIPGIEVEICGPTRQAKGETVSQESLHFKIISHALALREETFNRVDYYVISSDQVQTFETVHPADFYLSCDFSPFLREYLLDRVPFWDTEALSYYIGLGNADGSASQEGKSVSVDTRTTDNLGALSGAHGSAPCVAEPAQEVRRADPMPARKGRSTSDQARKGDPSLLVGKRVVNFRLAEEYLGIGERQRQKLIQEGALVVEGRGSGKKITTESLRAYLPPENPN